MIFLLLGWALRGLKEKSLEESVEDIKEKFRGNEAKILEWDPPKTEEERASEKVIKDLKWFIPKNPKFTPGKKKMQ